MGAIVLDCPDPGALAAFYAAILGRGVRPDSSDRWAELAGDEPVLAFQRCDSYQPPVWADGSSPQQVHVVLQVASLESSHDRVVALGATPLDPATPPPSQGSRDFRVYADPAGHPFCLCLD